MNNQLTSNLLTLEARLIATRLCLDGQPNVEISGGLPYGNVRVLLGGHYVDQRVTELMMNRSLDDFSNDTLTTLMRRLYEKVKGYPVQDWD